MKEYTILSASLLQTIQDLELAPLSLEEIAVHGNQTVPGFISMTPAPAMDTSWEASQY